MGPEGRGADKDGGQGTGSWQGWWPGVGELTRIGTRVGEVSRTGSRVGEITRLGTKETASNMRWFNRSRIPTTVENMRCFNRSHNPTTVETRETVANLVHGGPPGLGVGLHYKAVADANDGPKVSDVVPQHQRLSSAGRVAGNGGRRRTVVPPGPIPVRAVRIKRAQRRSVQGGSLRSPRSPGTPSPLLGRAAWGGRGPRGHQRDEIVHVIQRRLYQPLQYRLLPYRLRAPACASHMGAHMTRVRYLQGRCSRARTCASCRDARVLLTGYAHTCTVTGQSQGAT